MRPLSTAVLALLILTAAASLGAHFTGAQDPPVTATATVRYADGFDFPVGWPEGVGYNKARGFRPNGHLGEDWNGNGGGNTDLGDPIHAVANGLVMWARDVHVGWGNVVIIRHGYREPDGRPGVVDTLYGHLDRILVRENQAVTRGQQIATMGDNHGMYDAHLHFEIRKNLFIGMNRSAYARDFSNYYDPTEFIQSHRRLPGGNSRGLIAVNTYAPYPSGDTASAAEGAYELGTLRGPAVITAPLAGKSAFDIKRRDPAAVNGNPSFNKLNEPFRVDRFGDLERR